MARDMLSAQKIRERYNKALADRQLWSDEVDQAYRWMMPNRLPLSSSTASQFVTSSSRTRGEQRTNHIFDPTGMESVMAFANNVQTSMMPPYTQWAKIGMSDLMEDPPESFIDRFGPITDTTRDNVQAQLDNVNNILFEEIQKSRLETIINEAFQDLSIMMGVILLRPGRVTEDLAYSAVPANQVVIEEGPRGEVESVYVPHTIKARLVLEKWPDAEPNLPTEIRQQIKDAPESPVNLIESVVTFPNNPENQRHYYSLITQDGNHELLTEYVAMNPFIVFRGSKSPGEVYGRGPALIALPYVRSLNKMSEYVLRGMQMMAYPVYVMSGETDYNPYTKSIEPGAIFYAGPNQLPREALASITGAAPQVPLEWIAQTQRQVKEIMFGNPLDVAGAGDKTATEATIINNQWIQKNAGFFSRLSYELLPALIDKTILVLVQKGIIQKVEINGVPVVPISTHPLFKLEYNSPLAQVKASQEVQRINEAVQFSEEAFGGPQGLATMNVGEVAETVYEKMDIPDELINRDFKNSQIVRQIEGAVNGPQDAQTQPALTGNVNQGPNANPEPVSQTQQ